MESVKLEIVAGNKLVSGKAAAGAIIGGALIGGVGSIVGAAVGGRKYKNSAAVIVLEDCGMSYPLYIECDEKQFEKITKLFLM